MAKKLVKAVRSLPEDIQKDVIDKIQNYANQIKHSKLLGVELPIDSKMIQFKKVKVFAENKILNKNVILKNKNPKGWYLLVMT